MIVRMRKAVEGRGRGSQSSGQSGLTRIDFRSILARRRAGRVFSRMCSEPREETRSDRTDSWMEVAQIQEVVLQAIRTINLTRRPENRLEVSAGAPIFGGASR